MTSLALRVMPAVEAEGATRAYFCLSDDPVNCRVPKGLAVGKRYIPIKRIPH